MCFMIFMIPSRIFTLFSRHLFVKTLYVWVERNFRAWGQTPRGYFLKTGENALSGAMGTRPSCGVGAFMCVINRIDITLTLPQNFELTQMPGDQETKKTG